MLFEFFTVKEAIEFAAKLKLSIGKRELNEKVQEIIEELDLKECEVDRKGIHSNHLRDVKHSKYNGSRE